jgi:alpha-L-fucosidase
VRNQPGVAAYHVDLVAGKVTLPVERKGRYVRVQLAGDNALALAEVQVLKSEAPPPPAYRNVALGAYATQSSTENGGVPTRAQDGITDGQFSANSVTHTAAENQPWWQADLRSTQQLTSVVVWNRTDCCADRLTDFYVLVSTDPFASTDLDRTRHQPGVRAYHIRELDGPSVHIKVSGAARYVRVQLAGTGYLSLAEVQIFNNERPSQPDVAAHIRDNQFGMFIHYGLGTYTDQQWATPNTSPSVFNPTNLDTDQWARAAVSAGMRYGVLTTKHHDGFALWNTASNSYDVAASPYGGDVVRKYADSFRKAGLGVGLYYSIWDRTNGESYELVINQIRELLTGYGPINQIWFDQWQGADYGKIPYEPVRDFIRNVSPNTVIVNNDKNYTLATSDVLEYEDARPPAGLSAPTQMSAMISTSNWDWFNTKDSVAPRTTEDIVADVTYERDHGYQYLLNVGPSKDGRMAQVYTDRLAQVGAALAKR